LREAPTHTGPVLVDAGVNRTELTMKPRITSEMAKGFTPLHAEDGRQRPHRQIVELARTNIRR